MAKSPTSAVLHLDHVRLSFPVIFKPRAFSAGQEPAFQASFLLDTANAKHATKISELKSQAKKLALEAFGNKIPPDLKVCIGNGDNKEYDGYKGMIYVSARNQTRPTVVNRARNPVAEGDTEAPYAGCYVNATITLWAQNNQYGKRINANLRAIQFVEDGEAFGRGPVAADDEFEMLDDAPVGNTEADDFPIG